jgi:hypothetical protein
MKQLAGGSQASRAAVDRYLALLRSGGSDHPMALLQRAGVDLSSPGACAGDQLDAPSHNSKRRSDEILTLQISEFRLQIELQIDTGYFRLIPRSSISPGLSMTERFRCGDA